MRRYMIALAIVMFLFVMLSSNSLVYAHLGVSINLGQISVDEPLIPGGSYSVPSIGVRNSGNIASYYEMAVSYRHDQTELRPPAEWIEFDPDLFYLDPEQSRQVAVVLNIPANAEPGDYFAYLEVHPITEERGVAVGIAAGSKLYFSVKPANFFSAVGSQISSFFHNNSPFDF